MKSKSFFSKKFAIFALLAFSVLISGCLSFKGMFSEGQNDIQKANELWGKGQQLEALIYATQAVITDPVFIQGKTYLNDYFNQGIENAQNTLSKLEKPTISKDAELKFNIYDNLVKIYANLSKIKLPLKHPKGKWEFTTEIVDYTVQRDAARTLAFTLLMAEGRQFVKDRNIADAEGCFRNAVSNYVPEIPKQDSVKQVIVKELCAFAEKLSKAEIVDDAILSHSAFVSATKFVSNYEDAQAGIKKMKIHISNLYLKQGKSLENKGGVDNFKAAIEQFKKALEWNSQNSDAQSGITAVTTKIAEFYYQEGLKAQKIKDAAKAIAMFEEVRKFIPDYKDAMSRIYTIRMGGKIEELAKNLGVTQTEFGKLQSRVGSVSTVVDKSAEVMGKITYISDKTRSMNETMKTTANTLKLFNVIPTVGTVTGMLARSIDLVQDPVDKVAQKFTIMEQPVITPTKNVVDKTKEIVDNVKGKMESTQAVLQTTQKYSLKLKDCITTLTEEAKFKEAELAIDEINKGLTNTNTALIEINNSFTKVENEGKKVAQLDDLVGKVTKGIHDVDQVISKIQPIVNELNSALEKKFTLNLLVKKFTFSVKDILSGLPSEVKAIMGKFSDLAMGVIKPIMKKFDIKVPTIPGIDQIVNELDKMQEKYNTLNGELEKLKKSVTDYINYQDLIAKNITKLETNVGCKISVTQ